MKRSEAWRVWGTKLILITFAVAINTLVPTLLPTCPFVWTLYTIYECIERVKKSTCFVKKKKQSTVLATDLSRFLNCLIIKFDICRQWVYQQVVRSSYYRVVNSPNLVLMKTLKNWQAYRPTRRNWQAYRPTRRSLSARRGRCDQCGIISVNHQIHKYLISNH